MYFYLGSLLVNSIFHNLVQLKWDFFIWSADWFVSYQLQFKTTYSVLSRQEDLESSFALCKVLGLTLFPVTFLLILFCVIGVANGQPKTYLPPALFLVLFSSVLMPIAIIVTNGDTRSYSEDRILICLKLFFRCIQIPFKILKKVCKCKSGNVIEIIE